MTNLTFTPAAISDLDKIWDYTAEHWGIDQAERYTDDIHTACYELSEGIKVGRSANILDNYLKYSIGRHLVFFRKFETGIEIIRILHQSMDFERHL